MLGRWRGRGIHTQHPLDGLLEICNWYGKEFIDTETVRPLPFAGRGGRTVAVDPKRLPLRLAYALPIPRNRMTAALVRVVRPLLTTCKPRARLRMMEYRGRLSAAMIYDHLPVVDLFRKIDDRRVLGLMEWKGAVQPLFFVLERRSEGDGHTLRR